ncbi:threonine synthase [Francisella frigiditurris]|uniref:Threonine synthase n=3 Tax=Francisellaceae TaxID=34064 RepID=A0A1J0KSP3_9GAMM|nr:threonine synthase [Francisella frigiditurris]APC96714.1 threonine synthase [Francisella frigiditurris]
MYQIIDFITKEKVSTDDFVFAGESTPWEVQMDMVKVRSKINLDYFTQAVPCLSKYLPLMPIKEPANFVSLRENATPLIKSKVIGKELGIELYFKVEGKNPTGSFKDRGSAVDITIAKELGAKGIILASTGNMAASCACYAAAAKMPCFIIVPEGVSMSKLAQVMSFGGKIIQVKGSYNDAAKLAYDIAKSKKFFLAGDYAFRVEGQKTAAFEIVDQMLFQVPDEVIIPIGCGTNMTAYYKGFTEYNELGLIDKMPRLTGVQSTGADTLVRAFEKNQNRVEALTRADTIATAIAVPYPIDGDKAIDAIYNTAGEASSVTDMKMLEAQYILSTKEGLFVEVASASTVAHLLKKHKNGEIRKGDTVVCVLSGEGLKDPSVVLKSAIQPPIIYPNERDFNKLYDSKFFDNKMMIFVEQSQVIFDKLPTIEEIKKVLAEVFGANYDESFITRVREQIERFLAKGKAIYISDLQDVIQDATEMVDRTSSDVLEVESFKVAVEQDQQSKAEVIVKIDGQKFFASSIGVGPVDAVLNALRKACPSSIDYQLTDYKVKIRGQGADAVVYVEMSLNKAGIKTIGKAVSPDIIQASVEAFIDAYNIAYP